MLVVSRKKLERIKIGKDIEIVVRKIQGSRVVLGVIAPKEVSVVRGELDIKEKGDGCSVKYLVWRMPSEGPLFSEGITREFGMNVHGERFNNTPFASSVMPLKCEPLESGLVPFGFIEAERKPSIIDDLVAALKRIRESALEVRGDFVVTGKIKDASLGRAFQADDAAQMALAKAGVVCSMLATPPEKAGA